MLQTRVSTELLVIYEWIMVALKFYRAPLFDRTRVKLEMCIGGRVIRVWLGESTDT